MKEQLLPYPITQANDVNFKFTPIVLFDSVNNSSKQDIEILNSEEKPTEEKINFTKNNDLEFSLNTHIDFFSDVSSFKSPQLTQTFTEKPTEEKVIVINYNKINDTTNNWMFWVLLTSLVLFGWTRLLYRKQLDLIIKSFINYNFAVKSIRNNNEFSDRFSAILTAIFGINLSLFVFQTFSLFTNTHFPGLKSAGITIAIGVGLILLYGIKGILFKLLGFIFQERDYSQEYVHNIQLYNRVLGLFMFPIVISLAFVKEKVISHETLVYIGLTIVSLMFILRILRGIQISIRSNISILYMFLYFCTLEVLPILVLIKLGILIGKML